MGPIQLLYVQALRDYLSKFPETPAARPHQGLLEDRPLPPGLGPRPFRDPMQEGPVPPTDHPILTLYSKGHRG